MARGVELSTAYVSIAAETSQLSKGIGAAFKGADKVASKAGKSMGEAVSKAYDATKGPDFDKLAADAERADKAVAASAEKGAKTREAAARTVEIAETKVQEVRERSIRQDTAVKNAEKALNDARKSGDTDAVARAEKALGDAREGAKPTSADMAAEDKLVKARDGLVLATQKAEGELKGYQDAQEKANKALKESKDVADDAERSTEKAGNAFQRLGGRVQSALKGDFKGAFKGVERESESAADEVVQDFDGAGDDAGSGMLDGLGGALLGAAGALGIGASFGELFQQGIESVTSTAKLKASLGLSDGDAQALGKDAASAYKNGFGEDLGAATDATAAVSQYLGPDVDTQWATEMSLAMSDAFGNEPQDNIKAVAQMLRTGMVGSAEEGFDVLTKGFQSGADKAEDLTDTMGEYGTLFRGLGIDGATSIGLMSQGLNAGARDADKVADAFKEFGIRAVDGSDLTKQSLETLGLDADDISQRIGAGGETARDATQEVLKALGAVEDPATRAQTAVGLFGTQSEDLGEALYALDLDTAASGMGTIEGSTQKMSDALAEAQSPLDRLKRAFSDIGATVGGGMMGPLNLVVDGLIRVGTFFRDNPLVFAVVAAGVTAIGVAAFFTSGGFAALQVALGPINWALIGIIAAITLVVAALVWFFTKTELGQEIFAKAWGGIKAAAQAVASWFMNTLVPILAAAWAGIAAGAVWLYQNAILPAWNGIKAAISAVASWVMNGLIPFLQSAWSAIATSAIWLWQSVLVPVWNGIQAAISAVVGWIMNTAIPFLQSAWTAIASAAQWLYNSVILPVWNGIKLAIAIAVTAILLYVDWIVWNWNNVLAPAAMWLYNSVLKPVWDAIKTAIGAVVTWFVDTAWPMLKKAWDAVAAAAVWLYENGLKPAWNGIKSAIAAVVNWFQNTAWPAISSVVDWIRTKFEQFKTGLGIIWAFIKNNVINPVIAWFQNTVAPLISTVIGWIQQYFENFKNNLNRIWQFVKNNVINPVVAWFRDTAWPMLRGVIDSIKGGFQSLKDRLKTIWDNIKNNVVAPVANWFTDTLLPKMESVTDNIKAAFDVMKDGVKAAWDGIKSAARTPAKFVVEDVYDKTIKETFNGVASKLGIKTRLPDAKLGFASGGVLPGYTPGRDVHQFVSPTGGRLDLSGGEAIMRPEFTRAVGGAAGIADLNRRARKGEAFKDGGVWGKIKGLGGDAWDWAKDKASTIAEALGDPLGVLKKLAGKAMDLVPGGGMVRELVQKAGTNAATQGGEWLKDQMFSSESSSAAVPAAGSAGKGGGSLGMAQGIAASMGLTMTSGTRRGATTAQSGMTSLHALGRANDFAGSPGQMMSFFNAMWPYAPTELLYTPAGSRNRHRSGRMYPNTGKTASNHYSHVHVGFKDGGVMPGLFDQGGLMQPGQVGLNLTRKPEAVLDPRTTAAYTAHAETVAANDGTMSLSDTDRALLRAIAGAVDIKVDGRSVVRTVRDSFKGERMPLVTA